MNLRNFALALASLPLFAACDDELPLSVYIDPFYSSIAFNEEGESLVMEVKAAIFVQVDGFPGVVHIDSAVVAVTVDGETTTYVAPDVSTEDFPYYGSFEGLLFASFKVPSPIEANELESSCSAEGPSVTLTVRFYATQNDRASSEVPPLLESVATLPHCPGT